MLTSLIFFDDVAIELICDLDKLDATDQPRIKALEKQQEDLLKEVVSNEKQVLEKIKELLAAQPLGQGNRENLALRKKQMYLEESQTQTQ